MFFISIGDAMNFNQYIQYRALFHKAHIQGQAFNSAHTDRLFDELQSRPNSGLKNVSAVISDELFSRLENTLAILDISKRSFIELAIINALDQADLIMSEVDVFEGQPPKESDHADA